MRAVKKITIILPAVLLLAGGYVQNATGKPGDDEPIPAPDFTLPDLDGNLVSISDYKGKVVLLNFWATWCGPCKWEIPHLIELNDAYDDEEFAVLGVSLDNDSKGDKKVRTFAESYEINYPVLVGTNREIGKVVMAYGGFSSIPTTFIIDAEGNVYSAYRGARNKAVFKRDIDFLLSSE